MSHQELLKTTVDVRLSLSDWLILLGWCSAHLTEDTSVMVVASIRSIGKQVMGQ